MTILPASVTILDLGMASAATSTMMLEASYTSGSVATTVQIALSQIMTTELGALPPGGGTGQFLNKSSETSYASQWVNLASSLVAGTAIVMSGSTTVTVSVDSSLIPGTLPTTGATGQILENLSGTAIGTWVDISTKVVAGTAILLSGSTTLTIGVASTGIPGTLPTSGATGQILENFTGGAVGTWVNISAKVAAGTSITVSGSTSIVVSIADNAITSAQIGTFAVGSAKIATYAVVTDKIATSNVTFDRIQNVTGLSVVGRSGTATSTAAAITSGAGNSLLTSNAANTAILFQSVSTTLDVSIGSSEGALPYRNATTYTTLPISASVGFSILSNGTSPVWGATISAVRQTILTAVSGTFTAHTALVYAEINCLGGGGAGGGCVSHSSFLTSGGGGGAGAFSRAMVSAAALGASVAYTVGVGGIASTGNGGNGGTTSVGALCLAKGGSGGTGGTSGNFGAGGTGASTTGAVGDLVVGGGDGTYGPYNSGAAGFVPVSGVGGASVYGNGGQNTAASGATVATGIVGKGYGNGGSGAVSNYTGGLSTPGGTGAIGLIVIVEYCRF